MHSTTPRRRNEESGRTYRLPKCRAHLQDRRVPKDPLSRTGASTPGAASRRHHWPCRNGTRPSQEACARRGRWWVCVHKRTLSSPPRQVRRHQSSHHRPQRTPSWRCCRPAQDRPRRRCRRGPPPRSSRRSPGRAARPNYRRSLTCCPVRTCSRVDTARAPLKVLSPPCSQHSVSGE